MQESLAPDILAKLAEEREGTITLKAYMYTYAGITQLSTSKQLKQLSGLPNYHGKSFAVHQTEAPQSPDSLMDGPRTEALPISCSPISTAEDSTRHADASS
ncbi:hypothetical protein RHGRI_015689 [Rhododendron griersonianum]|uniref:Uncharacterized protein n=1 Tax=Rhododendron griersonianum TaxID=479676 RepID=A0AAV6KE73_9ERIC|nr:hypothetical protein RHGRI_015689 [Rhododendron griersonianum]